MSAYIYTRRSTEKQDTTHESQELECRAWADHNGYEVSGSFHDDCSGSVEVSEREGFLNAVNALQSGDVLIIKRRDRLGRSTTVNAIADQIVERIGARIISIDLGDMTMTPEGALIKGIFDQFAAFELALIKQRSKAALALRKRKGLITGSAPLGMSADDDGKLIPNEGERQAINRARELRAQGLKLRVIALRLSEEGIKARSGQAPSIATLSRWTKGVVETSSPSPHRINQPKRSRCSMLIKDKILTLRAQGLSIRGITEELKRFPEIVTSKGKPLAHTQVARILKSA